MDVEKLLSDNLGALAELTQAMPALGPALLDATALLEASLTTGGKLLCCGNGGSACDSAHFTAEIAGRYKIERKGFPAIDLTADHSILTALINDYPPEQVFAKQVIAQGTAGDVFVGFTTSGNSQNVKLALDAAKAEGLKTIAFLGKGGGVCKGLADVELLVPSDVTARVQEMHLMLYHTICEALDPVLAALD
ncbi:D-sedoheptulose-7-phosphate isomerase [Algisphaera agarilytica]|uniref:D-sedoheptulose 7-phosphate isomerase n=1 Tax=Algisphaera agarilytica TaxID=1385975 RepID=A0A7X0LK10_9BACT|nr:SIS domain-containing protein [Algisphaera agarilytica]MBB6429422.1 D-sedoheptulose 7-phosphate isomerase [Algisphaera agarilytica]